MNNAKILKILGTGVAVVVLITAGYFLRGYMDKKAVASAENTAQQFVSAVERGNNTTAYNLTGNAFKKSQTAETFNKTVAGLKTDKPVFEKADAYLKGGTLIYVQKVTGIPASDNGRTDAIYTLNVTKEGGKWKVIAVAIR
jgi:hypothetical protein